MRRSDEIGPHAGAHDEQGLRRAGEQGVGHRADALLARAPQREGETSSSWAAARMVSTGSPTSSSDDRVGRQARGQLEAGRVGARP